jgi:hypothetical protein
MEAIGLVRVSRVGVSVRYKKNWLLTDIEESLSGGGSTPGFHSRSYEGRERRYVVSRFSIDQNRAGAGKVQPSDGPSGGWICRIPRGPPQ